MDNKQSKAAAVGMLIFMDKTANALTIPLDNGPVTLPIYNCSAVEGVLMDVPFTFGDNSICSIQGGVETCDVYAALNIKLPLVPGACAKFKLSEYQGGTFQPYFVSICSMSNQVLYELEWIYQGCKAVRAYHETHHSCGGSLSFNTLTCAPNHRATFNEQFSREVSGCRIVNNGPCFSDNTALGCCKIGANCKTGSQADVYRLPGEPTGYATQYSIKIEKGDVVVKEACFLNQININDDPDWYPITGGTISGVFKAPDITMPTTQKIFKPILGSEWYVGIVSDRWPANNPTLFGGFQYTGGDKLERNALGELNNYKMHEDAMGCKNIRCSDNKMKTDAFFNEVGWSDAVTKFQKVTTYFKNQGSVTLTGSSVPTIGFTSNSEQTADISLQFALKDVVLYRQEACPTITSVNEANALSGDGVTTEVCAMIKSSAQCGKGVIQITGKNINPSKCIIDVDETQCCFNIIDDDTEYTMVASGQTDSTFKFVVETRLYSELLENGNSTVYTSSSKKPGFIGKVTLPGLPENKLNAAFSIILWIVVGFISLIAINLMMALSGRIPFSNRLAEKYTFGSLRKHVIRKGAKDN